MDLQPTHRNASDVKFRRRGETKWETRHCCGYKNTVYIFAGIAWSIIDCTFVTAEMSIIPNRLCHVSADPRRMKSVPSPVFRSSSLGRLGTGSEWSIPVKCHGTDAWLGVFTQNLSTQAGNGQTPRCSLMMSVVESVVGVGTAF